MNTGDPWSKQSCADGVTLSSTGVFFPNDQPPGLPQ